MNDSKNLGATEKRTLVEEGSQLKGSLTSTCPILVQGSLDGDVNAPAVAVSATGAISGKVTAGALKSDGKIGGTFDVDSAELTGTVERNTVVHVASLNVKLVASSGKLQLTFGTQGRGRS